MLMLAICLVPVQYLVSLVTSCKEVQYLEYLEVLYLVSQVTGWR